ncbi:MAG: glycoside hydrolase family 172 protein [Planctomycetota bacterium]|jgi:hypothetical protein
MNRFRFIIASLVCGLCSASAAEKLSYVDLVDRLTNLEQLAVLPQPGEKCAQFSSYDRNSTYDAQTNTYHHWNANGDGSGFIREENGKYVLAEMEGPGVIWRIWSALADKGRVAMYLDGGSTPEIDLPFAGYFDGRNKPFTRCQLVYQSANGRNCYVPIPYNKSCKIVADKGWGRYFHFTYTTFAKGTVVPTFKRKLSAAESAALDRVDRILGQADYVEPTADEAGSVSSGSIEIEPGRSAVIAKLSGAGVITRFQIDVDLPASADDHKILREMVLQMYWDQSPQPSVLSPIGDFFGTAPGKTVYRSLPMGMTDRGFYSCWYMPFADGALIKLVNEGTESRRLNFSVFHTKLAGSTEHLGRFHAWWHRDFAADPRRPIDWTFLKTEGRGRYCGIMLHIWNPKGGWWGEGDEKFFVDGERFPSTFGTGTEDYFGYAWCSEKTFNRAFHSQTVSVPQNPCAHPTPLESGGHTCNNRWHIADNIPFHTSFEGSLEKYFLNDRPTRYDCVVYWYQQEAQGVPQPLVPVEARIYRQAKKEAKLLTFLIAQVRSAAAEQLDGLRNTYRELMNDPTLSAHQMRLLARMAHIEKVAGNDDRAMELIEPLIDDHIVPFVDREFATDVLPVLQSPSDTPGWVRPVLVHTEDGSSKRVAKAGRRAMVTDRSQQKPYIYFSLPKGIDLRNKDRTVTMKVTYYCDGEPGNLFLIQYDSHFSDDIPGKYNRTETVVSPEKSGWHTATLVCPRARFAGRQNAGADFRISVLSQSDIFISNVEVQYDKD